MVLSKVKKKVAKVKEEAVATEKVVKAVPHVKRTTTVSTTKVQTTNLDQYPNCLNLQEKRLHLRDLSRKEVA